MVCPIIAQLAGDAQCPIPPHIDTHIESIRRMFRLTDWLARYYVPKILAHDDGRPCFPDHALRMAQLEPVRDPSTAAKAVELSRKMIQELGDYRDGVLGVAARHAYVMGTMAIEAVKGRAPLGAYGCLGIFEVALSLGMSLTGEMEQLMEWMLVESKVAA
jgi:hypothetical protein